MDTQNSGQSKSGLFGVLSLLGLLLTLLVAFFIVERVYQFTRQVQGNQPQNTISVSAEGKVKAVPDTAIISLGVLSQGKDAKEAARVANDQINKITEFAKSLGVDKEDITTSNSSINPRYEWRDGQNVIVGFDSNQTITVKVRGVDKNSDTAGKLMSGAVEKGANQVYGSQFVIDNPDDLLQEARKLAIEKAKVKAKELAEASGIRLGRVVSVSEGGSPGYPIMYGKGVADGIGGGGMMSAPVPSVDVQVGNQEVIASMSLVFEIK